MTITPDILGIWDGGGTCETGESLFVQLRILRSDVPGVPPLYVELLAGPEFLMSIEPFSLEEGPSGTFSGTSFSGPDAGSISFTVNASLRTLTGMADGVEIELPDLRECHAAEFVVRFTQP